MQGKRSIATSVTQPVTLRGRPTRPSSTSLIFSQPTHASRSEKRQNPWEMAEFLWTMNLFWRLTHHRFHQRVSESSSEVSQWDDVPRISHILVFSAIHRFHRVETRKNAVVSPYTRSSLSSAYLSLIFLSVAETITSSSSSTRDEVFPRFLS